MDAVQRRYALAYERAPVDVPLADLEASLEPVGAAA